MDLHLLGQAVSSRDCHFLLAIWTPIPGWPCRLHALTEGCVLKKLLVMYLLQQQQQRVLSSIQPVLYFTAGVRLLSVAWLLLQLRF